ncbi:ABC transporter ATP-binding protein [Nocardioides sp. CBS4Y-1]|uniref:ABC transporter ATP-binding protein n=1 Tax=Nocardioides acrostichi TaxID=2784339 RepID=A0A930UZA7_9ACTN|nr:ABC transporter ATP-binding protein [Nocardioides acrostichi]
MPTAPAIRVQGIGKSFPGVVANHDVTFEVAAGSIHALVGENGAGKSTLMKILYGVQAPDTGSMEVDGQPFAPKSPSDAIARGIGMVFQHFQLADNLTVLENVVLGAEKLYGIGSSARARINQLSEAYGFALDPDVPVRGLGVGARQRVEILKVLYRGARIIILDEPTAVLVPQEVDALFANLRELQREGHTLIFISHKLDEVLGAADDITVMRRGTTVDSVKPAHVTARQLAELMVGSELPSPQNDEPTVTDRVVVSLRDVQVRDGDRAVLDVDSLDIHAGEVVGIAGVEGNGQTELVEAIVGMIPASGSVLLEGQQLAGLSVSRRRALGIGVIPEDRHRHGLLLDSPLWENRILGHQTRPPATRGFWLAPAAAKADSRRIIADYDVRTPSESTSAGALSGGNQQKFIVGREMSGAPRLLVAAHPTRGVDVGAQAAIWGHIRAASREGLAVLLISADLDELIGLSDSIRVILRGRLSETFDPAHVTASELGSAMTGASTTSRGI